MLNVCIYDTYEYTKHIYIYTFITLMKLTIDCSFHNIYIYIYCPSLFLFTYVCNYIYMYIVIRYGYTGKAICVYIYILYMYAYGELQDMGGVEGEAAR